MATTLLGDGAGGFVFVDGSASAEAANIVALQAKGVAAVNSNQSFLALASPTNAQTLAQVQSLTRQMNALIRLRLGLLATISDT